MAVFTPTDEQHQAYNALVRHELIEQAKQALADAEVRVKHAAAALGQAETAYDAAAEASAAAVSGKGGDPHEAEVALEAAQRKLTVSIKVHSAAEQARDGAAAGIQIAEGIAHAPAYRAGIVMRFRACLAGEAARKALQEAQALYDQSSWILNGAEARGAGRVFSSDGHGAHHEVRPLEMELPHWRDSGLRPSWFDGDFEALIAEAKQ